MTSSISPQQTLESLRAARKSSGLSTSFSVSSNALCQAISAIDNGKGACVLDIGTKLTRLGYAGESTPRHIIRTEYVNESGVLITADDIFALNDLKNMKNSMEYYEDILEKFLRRLFQKVIVPSDRPIIVVENLFTSTDLRNLFTKIILQKMRSSSIMFMPSHICATFPFNTRNSLVIDIGYSECVAIPIIEGVTMLKECETARSFCGKQLEKRVRKLMEKHGQIEDNLGNRTPIKQSDWEDLDHVRLIETITTNLVCPNMEQAKKWKTWESENTEKPKEILKEKIVILNGRSVIVPSIVFETSMEIFFDEDLIDSFDKCLPKMLYRIVEQCPIDIRKKLFPNLLLTGGLSITPGFSFRLKQEIENICNVKQSKFAEEVKFYTFSELPTAPLFLSWLGASMFGLLRETVARRSITLEDWKSGKCAPDWTDFIMKER